MTSYSFRREGHSYDMSTRQRDPLVLREAIARVKSLPTRFSLLKLMAQSPQTYLLAAARDSGIDPSLAQRLGTASGCKESAALRVGTAVHYYALKAESHVVVYPGPRKGERWEMFDLEQSFMGNVVLSPAENARALAIADSLLYGGKACELLFSGTEVETRIDWQLRGRAIRSTPDAWARGRHVVDLKTCRDSSPRRMVSQIYSYLYHAQLECYAQAIESIDGVRPSEAWIVAVDGVNDARCYQVDPRGLEVGAKLLGSWSETLSVCEASGHFPYLEVFFAALPSHLEELPDMLELPPEEEEEEA